MNMGDSSMGALLFGVGPFLVFLIAIIIVARFILLHKEKTARRRHRRHGYTGYVSYNPTADPTYLNPADAPPPVSQTDQAPSHEAGHHHSSMDGGAPISGDTGGNPSVDPGSSHHH
jgi:hypothetical protein